MKLKYHFLDSGAFSLRNKAMQGHLDMKTFYDSEMFWNYIDAYAKFIKKYKLAIHYYANLDVIGNPNLSWRNQQYLEQKHGLSPVPVIHFGDSMDWIKFYLDKGYNFIGLGGLVGSVHSRSSKWLDKCFDLICDTPDRMPKVRVHGFGVSSINWLLRYPWWSIDSTTWIRVAGLGQIYVPKKRNGSFDFRVRANVIPISDENPAKKNGGGHFESFTKAEKTLILDWLNYIGVPLGDAITTGVRNNRVWRTKANLFFFENMVKEVSKEQRPFLVTKRKGLLS